MSDLISRSDVIQILKECNLDETLFEKDVFDKIRNLPTAYDVDKVVEQLEDYGNEEMEYYRNTPYEKCIEECVHKAIKVVKAGGNIELPEHSESQGD